MSQLPQYEEPKASKLPLTILVSRVVTLASLVVSVVILKTNNIKSDGYRTFTYKEIYSYKYAMFAMLIGFAYTLSQIPFAVYYLKTGKRLINHHKLLQCDFYGDKLLSYLLATAAGAAFGVTADLKKTTEIVEKLDNYFQISYISVSFLLVGFLSAVVSSMKKNGSAKKKSNSNIEKEKVKRRKAENRAMEIDSRKHCYGDSQH
ncbi:hypothetical protein RJ639_040004 [Escallonia herrerae]|uniref:CASP-like protein n=1 Tax=Escallonia herrerae TaxID=1293975 RepID=A0AA88WK14_9ASTE|nr:hypothetical protein RJ639_040004 [Escallonia herrerae]